MDDKSDRAKCPICGTVSDTFLKDGGSVLCEECDITFHNCATGEKVIGGPSPLLCVPCSERRELLALEKEPNSKSKCSTCDKKTNIDNTD